MNNSKKKYETKITDLIKNYKKINNKSLPYLYQKTLFDFVKEIPENWNQSNEKLGVFYSTMPSNIESLPIKSFENLLKYINITFFNEINKKLQNNEENSKTTKIKFNDLDEAPSTIWISKVENYVLEVESLLRTILKSNVDDEHNYEITMILSNDFSNLLENKLHNKFNFFAKFDNLLKKYSIKCVEHDFLNKSNEFTFTVAGKWEFSNKKINLNLEKNIILLFITKKKNDFRFQIHNKIEFWSYKDPRWFSESIVTSINFDKAMTNLSKAKVFAIKS